MKDWIGNSKSIYKTLGASNHSDKEREPNDFYATSPIAIDKLLTAMPLPKYIWECASGQGHLSKRLKSYGFEVYSSDLVNRGYGISGVDFLQTKELPELLQNKTDVGIITNPPFKYSTDFILHALNILPQYGFAIFLLRTSALEGKQRYERIYKKFPPKYVLQFSERLLCAKNADFVGMEKGGGSAVAYAWFVWQKGFRGDTIIKWI